MGQRVSDEEGGETVPPSGDERRIAGAGLLPLSGLWSKVGGAFWVSVRGEMPFSPACAGKQAEIYLCQ